MSTICRMVLVMLLFALPRVNAQPVVHELKVSRHPDTTLSNDELTNILEDASAVLKNKDGPEDVACDVEFKRDGDISIYADHDGFMDSAAKWTSLAHDRAYAKIVIEITFCGDKLVDPTTAGCGDPRYGYFVIRRLANKAAEGVMWAHEYGHTKGLRHREDRAPKLSSPVLPNPHALMTGLPLFPWNNIIDVAECRAFRDTAPVGAKKSINAPKGKSTKTPQSKAKTSGRTYVLVPPKY
jgi:hypothetical protein